MVNAAPVVQLARMLGFLPPSGSQRWCPSLILTAALWEHTCICNYEVSVFSPLLPCGWKRLTFFSFRTQLFKFSSKCQVVTGKIGNLRKFPHLITAARRSRSHLVFHNDMWQRRSSARPPIFIRPCISDHGWGRYHQLILGPSITLTSRGKSEDSLGWIWFVFLLFSTHPDIRQAVPISDSDPAQGFFLLK